MRHLRWQQVTGRVARWLLRPRPELGPAGPARERPPRWVSSARRRQSMIGHSRFRFLNDDGHLPDVGGWTIPDKSTLWLYNLHYFDDLNADGADARRDWHEALVARWISENAPGTGLGWEPYPTSLRIVNWIKWAWEEGEERLGPTARASLAVQARWLRRRLETHLFGNHLFANAKALVFAGCYFDGSEADAWLREAMRILRREIPEQVLSDGGHFERSTMYHSLVLEDMLDLINVTRARREAFRPWEDFTAGWPEYAERMGRWMSTLCHPDGEIAFFNDAAVGIAPSPAELTAYAERLGVRWREPSGDSVVHLVESGYVRAERDGAVLLVDVAEVGPLYLPGHAHADTLSFELSLYGSRVVVNSGTSRYGLGPERETERGTAAHSTVEVNGLDSSEVWAGFRVARRAHPLDVAVEQDGFEVTIRGAHDGYRRGLRGAVHRRAWRLRPGSLTVSDRVEGSAHRAVAHLHLHPDWQIEGQCLVPGDPQNLLPLAWRASGCDAIVVESTWHPEFGRSIASSALALRFRQVDGTLAPCRFELTWRPHTTRPTYPHALPE